MQSIKWIKKSYVDFLRYWYPRYEEFNIKHTEDGCGLFIEIEGTWLNTSMYEIATLAIVSEVYFRMQYDYSYLLKYFKTRCDEKALTN